MKIDGCHLSEKNLLTLFKPYPDIFPDVAEEMHILIPDNLFEQKGRYGDSYDFAVITDFFQPIYGTWINQFEIPGLYGLPIQVEFRQYGSAAAKGYAEIIETKRLSVSGRHQCDVP